MEPTTVIHQAELCKVPRKKPDKPEIIEYMSESAVKAVLEQPDTNMPKGLRHQFLMVLLYDTAARIQEAFDIRLADVRSASKLRLFGYSYIINLMLNGG